MHSAQRGVRTSCGMPRSARWRGQAFQRAAYLDGVRTSASGTCAPALRACRRAPAGPLLERPEGELYRRARHAQRLGDWDLGELLAGRQPAIDDELPQRCDHRG